jgi:hypothetical protein
MLIHQQNSHATSSKRCTGCRETQSRGIGQQSTNPPCISPFIIRMVKQGDLSESVMMPWNSSIYFRQHRYCIYALYVNYLLHVSAFRPSLSMGIHCCGSNAHTSHSSKFRVGIFCVVGQHMGWAVLPVVNAITWWMPKGRDRSRYLTYSVSIQKLCWWK